MLIHRQNSYAARGKRPTDRLEEQSREPVNKVKKKFAVSLQISRCYNIITECLDLVHRPVLKKRENNVSEK
jgi:hypothetical protein